MINGYHTYWSRPALAKGRKLSIPDYELLTMAVSACQFRRLGYPMTLVTDSVGAKFFETLGVTKLYDNVTTVLDKITGIDPVVFWAAGKIYAYELIQSPSISIDLDAVCWNIPDDLKESSFDVGVLHEDFNDWDCYHSSKELYGALGFRSCNWDWESIPYNVGVLYFDNDMLSTMYSAISQMFMENYTRFYTREMLQKRSRSLVKKGRQARVFEQIFAEQQLLSLVTQRVGARVYKFTEIDKSIDYIKPNRYVTHLWSMKNAYRLIPELASTVLSGLLNKLGTEYDETQDLLNLVQIAYNKRGRTFKGGSIDGTFTFTDTGSFEHSGSTSGIMRLFTVSNIKGSVKAIECCFGFERELQEGSQVVLGETIKMSENSSLTVRNNKSVITVSAKDKILDKDGYVSVRLIKGE